MKVRRFSAPIGLFGIFLIPLFLGCHATPRPHEIAWDELRSPDQRDQLVADAQNFLHARRFRIADRSFPFDCSGFVAAVLYRNGIDVYRGATELQIRGNGVRLLHQYLTRYGTLYDHGPPQPGDFVFFSNTYDLNRDGTPNDSLTHVGIVERVEEDGTIMFIHNLHHRVTRYVMNLSQPNQYEDENRKVINSYLRRRKRRDSGNTSYLAGELFAGFGSIVK